MAKTRAYSRYTSEALQLLGKQVRLGRKHHRWTGLELAERAGISRATLQKIEKGDPGVAIGLVFEVASLAGVKLFDGERSSLAAHRERIDDRLAVLPAAVRKSRKDLDDDF